MDKLKKVIYEISSMEFDNFSVEYNRGTIIYKLIFKNGILVIIHKPLDEFSLMDTTVTYSIFVNKKHVISYYCKVEELKGIINATVIEDAF